MNSRPTFECPAEERLLGWIDGTPISGRSELEIHVADCDHCLEVVGELLEPIDGLASGRLEAPPYALEQGAKAAPFPVGRRAPIARLTWSTRLLARVFSYRTAAVVGLASVAALLFLVVDRPDRPAQGSAPTWREGSTPLAGPVPRHPIGEVSAGEPVVFAWVPIEGVEGSVITIVDAGAGTTLVHDAAIEATYEISRERAAALVGSPLEWIVECTFPDGRTVRSAATPFRIVAPPGAE